MINLLIQVDLPKLKNISPQILPRISCVKIKIPLLRVTLKFFFYLSIFLCSSVVKESPAVPGAAGDADSLPGSGRLEKGMATHSSILA